MQPNFGENKLKQAKDVRDQIAEFLANGGKIQEIPVGKSAMKVGQEAAFVINHKKPIFEAIE